MIPRPTGVGALLRRRPVRPRSLARLLSGESAAVRFREIVRAVFPGRERDILNATRPGVNREAARVWAFTERVNAELFPIYDLDEYEQVVYGVPFVRNGWGYDRFHEAELPVGELLLFVLCRQPYEEDTRLAYLDEASRFVPRALLEEIPEKALTPDELREALEGTPYLAAADFADWTWGQTDCAFLDVDDEAEIYDADWTPEVVESLKEQRQRAEQILDRIGTLAHWLEQDPPAHFRALLDAALRSDAHRTYLEERRHYAHEITEQGLVPITPDGPDHPPLALPLRAAA